MMPADIEIPSELKAVSGAPMTHYRTRAVMVVWVAVFVVALFIALLIGGRAALSASYEMSAQGGTRSPMFVFTVMQGLGWLLIGLGLTVGGALVRQVYRALFVDATPCVVVCSNGVFFNHNGQDEVWRWCDVNQVWLTWHVCFHGVFWLTEYELTLVAEDGRRIKFDSIWKNYTSLGEQIQECVSACQLPGALSALDAGQEILFGDRFGVRQTGLIGYKCELNWADIESVGAGNGQVVIRQKGKFLAWLSVDAHQVPNLRLFQKLVQIKLGDLPVCSLTQQLMGQ